MAWDEGQTLGERFEHACATARAQHGHWRLGLSYSGFSEALLRFLPQLAAAVKIRFQQQMQFLAGPHWRARRWCAFAVDGTRIEAPHTLQNEQGLGCAGRAKTAPQVFLTTLWHLGLGLPWDYRVGPGTASERGMARDMLADLPPGSLLVADAGFVGYSLARAILRRGHSFLLRVGGNVTLLRDLGYYERSGDRVYLWPEQYRKCPPLVLRLIVLHDPSLKPGKRQVYLLTNVLDEADLTVEEAAELYARRWGEEVYHRSLKQTLARRRLLSRTSETCLAEAQVNLLGLWLLGLLSVREILAAGGDPLQWSVAASRNVVRAAIRNTPPRQSRRRPRRRELRQALAAAVRDKYQRTGSKTARNYPRKKREKPPGPPKIKPASEEQVRRATQLPPPKIPKRWTA